MIKLNKFIVVFSVVFIGNVSNGNACGLANCPHQDQNDFKQSQSSLSSSSSSSSMSLSSSSSAEDHTNRKRKREEGQKEGNDQRSAKDTSAKCSAQKFQRSPIELPMDRSLISSDWWRQILSYLPDSEQGQMRVSKSMNSIVEAERNQAIAKSTSLEVKRSIAAGRRWEDLRGISDVQAYLHDRNFWRGFLTFLRSVDLWSTSGDLIPVVHTNTAQMLQLRSQIAFYLTRVQPGSLAESILEGAYKFLRGRPNGLKNVCNSTDLHAQADSGHSSAQDVLSFCYLHGIGVEKSKRIATHYASLAADVKMPFHPQSNFSFQKIRYLELLDQIGQHPFRIELLPAYREIFQNPFASIEIKRQIIEKAYAVDDIDHQIELGKNLLAPCTEWFCNLLPRGDSADERILALAYFYKQEYNEASQLFDRILSSPEAAAVNPAVAYVDKRYTAVAHWNNRNHAKALALKEQILKSSFVTLDDRRDTIAMYSQVRNYKRSAELWDEIFALVGSSAIQQDAITVQDKRAAAIVYFEDYQYKKSTELWDEILPLVGRSVEPFEKRIAAIAYFQNNEFKKSAIWFGKLLASVGPAATWIDKRNAAISFYYNEQFVESAKLWDQVMASTDFPLMPGDKQLAATVYLKSGQYAKSTALMDEVRTAELLGQIANSSSATAMTGRQE